MHLREASPLGTQVQGPFGPDHCQAFGKPEHFPRVPLMGRTGIPGLCLPQGSRSLWFLLCAHVRSQVRPAQKEREAEAHVICPGPPGASSQVAPRAASHGLGSMLVLWLVLLVAASAVSLGGVVWAVFQHFSTSHCRGPPCPTRSGQAPTSALHVPVDHHFGECALRPLVGWGVPSLPLSLSLAPPFRLSFATPLSRPPRQTLLHPISGIHHYSVYLPHPLLPSSPLFL